MKPLGLAMTSIMEKEVTDKLLDGKIDYLSMVISLTTSPAQNGSRAA